MKKIFFIAAISFLGLSGLAHAGQENDFDFKGSSSGYEVSGEYSHNLDFREAKGKVNNTPFELDTFTISYVKNPSGPEERGYTNFKTEVVTEGGMKISGLFTRHCKNEFGAILGSSAFAQPSKTCNFTHWTAELHVNSVKIPLTIIEK